jgi:hypothetical protein
MLAAGSAAHCIVLEHNLLDLNSTNMLNLTSPPESLGADFREAEILDLALLLQLLHLLDSLLNRRLLIYAVAVIKINTLDAEALQRLLASFAAVLGSRVCLDTGPVVFERQSELRGQEDLLALAGVLSEPVAFAEGVLSAIEDGREIPPRSADIPRRSSLSAYTSAVSQKNRPSWYSLSRTLKRSSFGLVVP